MLSLVALRAGIIFIVLALIIFAGYLLVGRRFSIGNVRLNMQKRVQEIRDVISTNEDREDERIKQVMKEYIADRRIALRDMVRLTISQSGMKINFYHFIILTLSFTILGFFLGINMHNLWLALFIPLSFSQIMFIIVRFGFNRRQAAFRVHSSEVMSQINNLYKTSRNLLMATMASIDTMPQPFHGLFSALRRDLEFMSLDDAIERALQAVIDPNFRLALILIRESEKTGISVEREWQALCDIYEDERDIRMAMSNEMNKEKTESIILGIIPIILLILGFFLLGGDFNHLIMVPWINTMVALVVSFIIIGFLMLPRIFALDLE